MTIYQWTRDYTTITFTTPNEWNTNTLCTAVEAPGPDWHLRRSLFYARYMIDLEEDITSQVWPGYARADVDPIFGAHFIRDSHGFDPPDLKGPEGPDILVTDGMVMRSSWFWQKVATGVQSWTAVWSTTGSLESERQVKPLPDNTIWLTTGFFVPYSESIPAEGLAWTIRGSCYSRMLWSRA